MSAPVCPWPVVETKGWVRGDRRLDAAVRSTAIPCECNEPGMPAAWRRAPLTQAARRACAHIPIEHPVEHPPDPLNLSSTRPSTRTLSARPEHPLERSCGRAKNATRRQGAFHPKRDFGPTCKVGSNERPNLPMASCRDEGLGQG